MRMFGNGEKKEKKSKNSNCKFREKVGLSELLIYIRIDIQDQGQCDTIQKRPQVFHQQFQMSSDCTSFKLLASLAFFYVAKTLGVRSFYSVDPDVMSEHAAGMIT
jgi:hypothetical protein